MCIRDSNDDTPNESIHKDNEDQTENESAGRSNLYISDKSKSRILLYLNTSSTHEDIRYKARYKGDIKKHNKSFNEGIKYSCNHCDYQATTQSSLKTHKQSVHEGIKYSCN